MPLEIRNLSAEADGKKILSEVSLAVNPGELHVIMGPNGSGKSTLANAIAGSPHVSITSGSIAIDGQDITELSADKRARAGLFLSFQYPVAVPGVSVQQFVRAAQTAIHDDAPDALAFRKSLVAELAEMGMDESFAGRFINDGFSGGEKKRLEMLQLSMLKPKYAICDETDSGLDVDALQLVAKTMKKTQAEGTGLCVITHYPHILNRLQPDRVHILVSGRIIVSGGPEIIRQVETKGYQQFEKHQHARD